MSKEEKRYEKLQNVQTWPQANVIKKYTKLIIKTFFESQVQSLLYTRLLTIVSYFFSSNATLVCPV